MHYYANSLLVSAQVLEEPLGGGLKLPVMCTLMSMSSELKEVPSDLRDPTGLGEWKSPLFGNKHFFH